MKTILRSALLAAILTLPPLLAADDPPDPAKVIAAMRKANDFYLSKLASHGGYASAWKRDLT